MSLVGQAYDEPGSWGRLSARWPKLEYKTEEAASAAYFAVIKAKLVPYGSYVLVDRELRIETPALIAALKKKCPAHLVAVIMP